MANSSHGARPDTSKDDLFSSVLRILHVHGIPSEHANLLHDIIEQASQENSRNATKTTCAEVGEQTENLGDREGTQQQDKKCEGNENVQYRGDWDSPPICIKCGSVDCLCSFRSVKATAGTTVDPAVKEHLTDKEALMDLMEHVLSTRFGLTAQREHDVESRLDFVAIDKAAHQDTQDGAINCCSDPNSACYRSEVSNNVLTPETSIESESPEGEDAKSSGGDGWDAYALCEEIDELKLEIEKCETTHCQLLSVKRRMAIELWDLRAKVQGLKDAFNALGMIFVNERHNDYPSLQELIRKPCEEWGDCADGCYGECHGRGDCQFYCNTNKEVSVCNEINVEWVIDSSPSW